MSSDENVTPNEEVVDPYSKLRSIRVVEFRQALRGYNIDDVDEYLEQVAVEVDTAFEQIRQLSDQLNQSHARVAQLESNTVSQVQQASVHIAEAADALGGETLESLQRTLLMAQKFVDQVHAEAQEQSRSTIAAAQQQAHDTVVAAEQRAREMLANADAEAKKIITDTEGRMRSEVARLEQVRARLANEVEMVAKYLDGERGRLRGVLAEMLAWVDEKFNPAVAMLSSGDQVEDARGTQAGYDTIQSDTAKTLAQSGATGGSGNGDSTNKSNHSTGKAVRDDEEQHGYSKGNISNGQSLSSSMAFSQSNGYVSDIDDPLNPY